MTRRDAAPEPGPDRTERAAGVEKPAASAPAPVERREAAPPVEAPAVPTAPVEATPVRAAEVPTPARTPAAAPGKGMPAFDLESPWPADVPGFKPPAPGEHPRLFFRRGDLPALRARARTPEGQAVLKRLRFLLNRGDGESMPSERRPVEAPYGDQSEPIALPDGAYSMSHAAGFGFLYQLTGEKKYADLGRQCFEWAFDGVRDRDAKGRYSWKKPTGALRAGPSLGWYSVAYDLCYDGWDEAFRRKVALAIQDYNEGEWEQIEKLARGARLGFGSNHAGPQIGGAALALLAIRGDPGVNGERVEGLLKVSAETIVGQLTKGWGADGFYTQGDGAGCISSDNALIPAMQAWRVAGGRDFITPRPNAQMMTLKWLYGTVTIGGKARFPSRGMYPHNVWARSGGLSGCGQFAQGFGAVDEAAKPALLWLYNHCFREADDEAHAPFDTPSPYPHRAVLAFVNWPFDLQERDPAEVLPRVSRRFVGGGGYFFCRNQWKDETDIAVSVIGYNIYQTEILGRGLHLKFSKLPGSTFTYYRDFDDGSMIVSNPKGKTYLAVDFSRKAGADLVYIVTGSGATGGQDHEGAGGATVKGHSVTAGANTYLVCTWQTGAAPEVAAEGDKVRVGGRLVHFDGEKLVLEHLNAEDAKAP
jgi:hypothetical protein